MKEKVIDTHTFIGNPGKLHLPHQPAIDYFEKPEFEDTKFLVIPFSAQQTEQVLFDTKRHPRITGMYLMANPNPDSPLWTPAERAVELSNYVKEEGVVGIKSHPSLFDIPMIDKRFDPYYQLAVENKIPVLLHAARSGQDYNSAEMTRQVLERFPDLTMILAHFGGLKPQYMREAVDLAEEYGNLYLNTTCMHLADEPTAISNKTFGSTTLVQSSTPGNTSNEISTIFKDATERIPKQILFGSDLGFYHPEKYSRWPVTDTDPKIARQILQENPRRLFGARLLNK